MELGQLVRNLRVDKGWTVRQLGEKIGITHGVVSQKERGLIAIKPPERRRIAEVFGLTIDEFDAMWKSSDPERTWAGEGIPIINIAPAGVVLDLEELPETDDFPHKYAERGAVNDRLAFAVKIVGDSMEPTLYADDLIVLVPVRQGRPGEQIKNGDVAFVRFSGSAKRPGCTIARYHRGEGDAVMLTKDNRRYPPIQCSTEDVANLARVVERRTGRI